MAQTAQAAPADQPPAPERPAGPAVRVGHRGETVTIACKLPNGLVLRNFAMVDRQESSPMGSRTVKMAEQVGEEFTVRGNAVDIAKLMKMDVPNIAHGYAITTGCPRALWEHWYEANKNSDLVRNHMIWALDSDASAKDWARDHREVRSGLEPIDPDNPARTTGVRGVERGKVGEEE